MLVNQNAVYFARTCCILLACVAWRFWLGALSNKGGRGQRNREEIRAGVIYFSFFGYCVISVWVSAVYAKYVSTPIHPVEFPQKNQFPNKPGFPLSTLIILDWYPYVSLFPDLLCKFGLSVSGLRKIRFNAYTPRRISPKKSVPKQTRIPVVQVNNFSLVSLRFSVPWFIV